MLNELAKPLCDFDALFSDVHCALTLVITIDMPPRVATEQAGRQTGRVNGEDRLARNGETLGGDKGTRRPGAGALGGGSVPSATRTVDAEATLLRNDQGEGDRSRDALGREREPGQGGSGGDIGEETAGGDNGPGMLDATRGDRIKRWEKNKAEHFVEETG